MEQTQAIKRGRFIEENKSEEDKIVHTFMGLFKDKIKIESTTRNGVGLIGTYTLSDKALDMLLNKIAEAWQNKPLLESNNPNIIEFHHSNKDFKISIYSSNEINNRGELQREHKMNININKKSIVYNLSLKDSRRFYATLKELKLYGKSNKLK